jgi:hypothetical protein
LRDAIRRTTSAPPGQISRRGKIPKPPQPLQVVVTATLRSSTEASRF